METVKYTLIASVILLSSCSDLDTEEFEIPDGYVYESDDIESDVTDDNADDEDEDGSTTTANGYEYVDLGLTSGLKWATINIGATLPADEGNYYAWGETRTKEIYSSTNCVTYGVDMDDISGNATYDAATRRWGSPWRMPTQENFQELIDECTWTYTTQQNSEGESINGVTVKGSNGNSIFLPHTLHYLGVIGYNASEKTIYLWSSTPKESDPYDYAYLFDCGYSSKKLVTSAKYTNFRYAGFPIRPIYDENFEFEEEDSEDTKDEQDSESLTILAGDTQKKWKWDTSWRSDGYTWGNAGYAAGTEGNWYTGIWWGCSPEELAETQLSHSDTGVATGEEDSNAYMTFSSDGTLKSYDSDGTVIRSGKFSVSGYDGTYNQAAKDGTANWCMGTLSTTEGTILWPFQINGGGTAVGNFEIVYLDENQMQLVYAEESTGNWSECTWWAFHSATNGTINDYDYVDLGLTSGLKWATVNIGATLPADYGNYYAWGETETKDTYTTSNSVTYGVEMDDISGDATYDAATANWGSTWRMPTKAECQEIVDECTWTWTTQEDSEGEEINGYLVEGPNGNSIFLPAAGYRFGSSLYNAGTNGNYWSSTPDASYSGFAYTLGFNRSLDDVSSNSRHFGWIVRPVSD